MTDKRTLIIFGATGDLASRLLLPGLGCLLPALHAFLHLPPLRKPRQRVSLACARQPVDGFQPQAGAAHNAGDDHHRQHHHDHLIAAK